MTSKTVALVLLLILAACSGATPVPEGAGETERVVPTTESKPQVERQNLENMATIWPTANVLNPILWLGCRREETAIPIGSGVVVQFGEAEYLATALHVAEPCGMRPLVRFDGRWNPIDWETVATSQADDIGILRTDTVLDEQKIPINHGTPEGMIYGQLGYALGFPEILGPDEPEVDHIVEAGGRPIPIAALAIANLAPTERGTYSSSYINAGFSGGAVVFPVGTSDWTIAGIITHFPTVPRAVYRDGKETGDYTLQHTGLVGFTPMERIVELIDEARAKSP